MRNRLAKRLTEKIPTRTGSSGVHSSQPEIGGSTGIWGHRRRAAAGLIVSVLGFAVLMPGAARADVSNAQPVAIKATVGVKFSGTVATFQSKDTGPFEVQVDWGDGSSSSLNFSPAKGGTYDAPGVHTYSQAGDFKVAVTITDTSDKGVGMTSGTAHVSLAKPPFGISNQTPMTGQPVVFDLSRYEHRHGGALDFRLDLNGDG